MLPAVSSDSGLTHFIKLGRFRGFQVLGGESLCDFALRGHCHFQHYLAQRRQHYLAYAVFLGDEPGSRANSRETVAGWILNSRAASAAVLPPFETIFLISACC